jgi:hypothetical protein
LQFPEEQLRDGQQSLFLSKDLWPSMKPRTIDEIWEELRSI